MRKTANRFLTLAAAPLLACAAPLDAQTGNIGALMNAPIAIERAAPVTSVPLEQRDGKYFLVASVDGIEREFVFDTGSPTILSRELAEALELEILGQNTGTDAHGAAVTMDIARTGTIALGDIVFRDVPVFVHDFGAMPLGRCFFDGGVLGSEIFAGSAWRIDAENGRLQIAESTDAISIADDALTARLHDTGYPHAPVVEYAIGSQHDRALFDTGSEVPLSLYAPLLTNPAVEDRLHAVQRGRGSEGVSAGGRGAVVDLARFRLSRIALGDSGISNIGGISRSVPPTLLGAGLLDRFVVTLDYPGERFVLESRAVPANTRPEPGYRLALVDDRVEVVQLFEGSAADDAGLRLEDRIIGIDGRVVDVAGEQDLCALVRFVSGRPFEVRALSLEIDRDGSTVSLRIPAPESPAGAAR